MREELGKSKLLYLVLFGFFFIMSKRQGGGDVYYNIWRRRRGYYQHSDPECLNI
jgi:hypothetical protein